MEYFAYGSNMKTKRLENRVGEVNAIGWAIIKNYCLKFNKLGTDGSGKANIEPKEDSFVEGVLFDLTEEQLKKLDRYEGVNDDYIRCTMDVIRFDNKEVAGVYIGNQNTLRGRLKPNCEYLQYLIDGANEHGLSDRYKKFLTSFDCI